jgi:hypothetical protein
VVPHSGASFEGRSLKYHFKITRVLLDAIRTDLARPHEHAWERVGFIRAGLASAKDETLLLAAEYAPVADEDYEKCWSVGAKINATAIRKALAWADGWRGGIVHVHAHEHFGRPKFSPDDIDGNGRLIPSFFNIAPARIHGAIVLSRDQLGGAVWPSKVGQPIVIKRISIVGAPLTRLYHEPA